MAIRDLFPACPVCGSSATLRSQSKTERCHACNTTFRRTRGANIRARLADGSSLEHSPQDWLNRLSIVAPSNPNGGGGPISARVKARTAGAPTPLHRGEELLGWIEQFGPPRTGAVHLDRETLTFVDDGGAAQQWRLSDLTAVQPSSTSLQIKVRGQPVVSLQFLDASLRFWEERIHLALHEHYRYHGRGEILEFQPRIVCR